LESSVGAAESSGRKRDCESYRCRAAVSIDVAVFIVSAVMGLNRHAELNKAPADPPAEPADPDDAAP
jgi:hypothetical protein